MNDLTDEQLNIAICEARGWKKVMHDCWEKNGSYAGTCGRSDYAQLPSHITGIEALGHMAEAEKALDSLSMDERSKWLDYLAMECEWPNTKNAADLRFETHYLSVRATARQRAIAFLRVVKPELFQ